MAVEAQRSRARARLPDREAVVDHAVAVIVQPVARFGRRLRVAAVRVGRTGRARPRGRADDQAVPALADAVAGRAHRLALVGEVLVGQPVAVVVLAVAHLGAVLVRGPVRVGRAGGLHLGRALDDARAALADPVTGLPEGRALVGEVLVGDAVAVVVLAVAEQLLVREVGHAAVVARPAALDALGGNGLARADAAETAVVHRRRHALVGVAVAVVVQPVAQLGPRLGMRPVRVGRAGRRPVRAAFHDAQAAGAVAHAQLADRQPVVRHAVVDHAVAVVVLAVADFRIGLAGRPVGVGRARRVLVVGLRALDRAGPALAQALARPADARALVREALVGQAIAVVVLAVADLDEVLDQLRPAHDALAVGRADQHAGLAQVQVRPGARLPERRPPLVGGAVAVVVLAVADFRSRRLLRHADDLRLVGVVRADRGEAPRNAGRSS